LYTSHAIDTNKHVHKGRLLLTAEYKRAPHILAVIYSAIFRECQYLKTDADL